MKPSLSALVLLSLSVCVSSGQTGTLSILHTFTGLDGYLPSSLIQDKSGNLYGTTTLGGDFGTLDCAGMDGCGVVFEVVAGSDLFKVVHEFNGDDGAQPDGIVHAPDGALYGVTTEGVGADVIFSISPQGAEKDLYTFSNFQLGYNPSESLSGNAQGDLYGLAGAGGTNGDGVIYKFSSRGVYSVVHNFDGLDGSKPSALSKFDSSGNLFGSTTYGGTMGYGVIFKLDSTEAYTVLYNFSSSNGFVPPLIEDAQGNLYGAAYEGGSFGGGFIFKLDQAGAFTVLYNFNDNFNLDASGANPNGPLVRDDNTGTIYGTTQQGGLSLYGAIFRLDSAGNETLLYSFASSSGFIPVSGLVGRKSPSGSVELFGTTSLGGPALSGKCAPNGCGTVFKFTLNQ